MTTLGVHVNRSEIALGVGPGPHGAQRSGSSPLPREPEDAWLAGHLAELLQKGWDGIHDVSLDLGSLIDGWLHSDAPERLGRVTVVRISPSFHTIQAPFDAWPVRIREVIDGGWLHVPGGVDLHGGTGPALDLSTLDRAVEHAERAGSSAICLSSVGALLDPSWETAAAEHLMRRAPSLPIVMAHEVGGRRFHERETAALLNAALLRAVDGVLNEILPAAAAVGARISLVRADGSRTSEQEARSLPVQLFGTQLAMVAQGAAAIAGEPTAHVLAWSGRQVRLLTLEEGVLRPRHLRNSSVLSGVRLSQRHAAQSQVVGPAKQAISRELVGARPVVIVRTDWPGSEQSADQAYQAFADAVAHSLSQAHVVDLPPGQLAAHGAAQALPQSEILRYAVVADRHEVEREQLAARRVAQGRVIAAVDWPVTLETLSEYYSPLSFLPSGPVLIRSHVVGRPKESAWVCS